MILSQGFLTLFMYPFILRVICKSSVGKIHFIHQHEAEWKPVPDFLLIRYLSYSSLLDTLYFSFNHSRESVESYMPHFLHYLLGVECIQSTTNKEINVSSLVPNVINHLTLSLSPILHASRER